MIKDITLRRLRADEYIQLMTDLLGITNAAPASTIQPQRTALLNKVQELDGIFKTDRQSALTDDLAGLDAQRDGLLTGISLMCRAYTYHTGPVQRAAGETLLHSLDVYGGAEINQKSYNAQSTTITNLLADWTDNASLAQAVSLLGIDDWLSSLQSTNESFKTMSMSRTTQTAESQPDDTIGALRLEANTLWYSLRNKVAGYYQVADGAAPWDTIVSEINTRIDEYNALLASRKDGDQPGNPPTP